MFLIWLNWFENHYTKELRNYIFNRVTYCSDSNIIFAHLRVYATFVFLQKDLDKESMYI